jgi:hypothetical protein
VAVTKDDVVSATRSALWPVAAWTWWKWSHHGKGLGFDAHSYWSAWQGNHMYGVPPGLGGYLYSPAFAQAVWPLTLLSWRIFLVMWSVLLLTALAWLLWPLGLRWGAPLFAFGSAYTLVHGNVQVFLATAAVIGMRHPAAWAFPLLCKISPGVGVAWFLFRREWRTLAKALGATLGVGALSFVVAPHLWFEWVDYLSSLGPPQKWVRYPMAVGILAWGALTDRRWTVAVSMLLVAPVPSSADYMYLAALPRLMGWGGRDEPSVPASGSPKLDRRSTGALTPGETLSGST